MMRSTTSIPNMSWAGDPSGRKTYLRMVQISVTSLGIIARRIYNGEAADESNTSMAWSIFCMLTNGPTSSSVATSYSLTMPSVIDSSSPRSRPDPAAEPPYDPTSQSLSDWYQTAGISPAARAQIRQPPSSATSSPMTLHTPTCSPAPPPATAPPCTTSIPRRTWRCNSTAAYQPGKPRGLKGYLFAQAEVLLSTGVTTRTLLTTTETGDGDSRSTRGTRRDGKAKKNRSDLPCLALLCAKDGCRRGGDCDYSHEESAIPKMRTAIPDDVDPEKVCWNYWANGNKSYCKRNRRRAILWSGA